MNFQDIEEKINTIKVALKKDRKKIALELLEDFINTINDNELEREIIVLWSKYNSLVKKEILGIEEKQEEQNKLTLSITLLLQEAKQSAFEKISFKIGDELSIVAKQGSEVVEELKELNLIMAKSRLLELGVIRKIFGNVFSKKDSIELEMCISDLKNIIEKHNQNDIDFTKDGEEDDLFKYSGEILNKIPKQEVGSAMKILSKLFNRNE